MMQNLMGVSFCFVAFLATFSARAKDIAEKDTGNLGEIRYSILSVENFQKIYGEESWVLLKGQKSKEIAETDLVKENLWPQNEPLPDARGVFLRCKDHGIKKNPDGDLQIGTPQMDEMRAHTHGLHPDGSEIMNKMGFDIQNTVKVHRNSKHSNLHTGFEGGNETRPKCITVNAFIKVSRTHTNQTTSAILDAVNGLPVAIANNPALGNVIQRMVQVELDRRGVTQINLGRK